MNSPDTSINQTSARTLWLFFALAFIPAWMIWFLSGVLPRVVSKQPTIAGSMLIYFLLLTIAAVTVSIMDPVFRVGHTMAQPRSPE